MDNFVQNRGLGLLGEAEKTLSAQQHGDYGRGRPLRVLSLIFGSGEEEEMAAALPRMRGHQGWPQKG